MEVDDEDIPVVDTPPFHGAQDADDMDADDGIGDEGNAEIE